MHIKIIPNLLKKKKIILNNDDDDWTKKQIPTRDFKESALP